MGGDSIARLLALAALWGGSFWGVLFLAETLTANMLAGCALILAGTWFALRGGSRATAGLPRGAPLQRPCNIALPR